MPAKKKTDDAHKVLEEIKHISQQLNHLETIDFKILNHVSGRLQDLEKHRREDHLLLLKISGQFEDIDRNLSSWKSARKFIAWVAVIMAGFTAYISFRS